MITIGQLARYVGVSIKTIRVYHDKGLLPEPDRDASGYRRYGADDAIDLIKIRTLADSGVPLARIRDLRSATDEEFQHELREIDDELTARIAGLRAAQGRLRRLAAGQPALLPTEIGGHLADLARWGFTPRWVDLQRDLWILVFATHPDQAITLFRDQTETLADPRCGSSSSPTTRHATSTPATPASTASPAGSPRRPGNATDPTNRPSSKRPPRSPPSSRAPSTPRPRHGGDSTCSSAHN